MPTLSAGFTSGVSRSSDPLLLPGMPSAVARLSRALDAREEIVVFGDYDADGVTDVALLLPGSACAGRIHRYALFINRLQGGYGFFQRRWRVVVSWGVHHWW